MFPTLKIKIKIQINKGNLIKEIYIYKYKYKFPLLKKLELIAMNLESGFSNKSESNSISA